MADAPEYTHCGKQVLRDNKHFADACSQDVAEALAIILNGQVMMGCDVPAEKQDWVAGVLWP